MTAFERGPHLNPTALWWIEVPFRRSETDWEITAACKFLPLAHEMATRRTHVIVHCAVPMVREGVLSFYFPCEVENVMPPTQMEAWTPPDDISIDSVIVFGIPIVTAYTLLKKEQYLRFADMLLKSGETLAKVRKRREEAMASMEQQFLKATGENHQLQCKVHDLERVNYELRQQIQTVLPMADRAAAELPPQLPTATRLLHRVHRSTSLLSARPSSPTPLLLTAAGEEPVPMLTHI